MIFKSFEIAYLYDSQLLLRFFKITNEIAVHKAVQIGFFNPNQLQIVTIYLYQQNTDEKKKRTSFYNWFFFWIKIRDVFLGVKKPIAQICNP